jgi:uncharacterized protein YraI
VAACVASPEDDSASGGGKADGTTPVLRFKADWSEAKTGTLLAGSAMRIEYDLARLTDCRGSTNGSEVWGVSGYASFDGGTPVTFAVSRLDSSGKVQPVAASVEIPASASNVALWFAINNRWGCIAYDSNAGANYTWDISRGDRGAVLAFNADWSESQSEAIHAGDQVVVHYDPARLEQCQGSSGGNAVWSITGYYQVDGGATKTVMVTRAAGSTLVAADPIVTVPRGHDLEMWFSATNIWGCNASDSNMNANYHFTIE